MQEILQNAAMAAADWVAAVLPQRVPNFEALNNCKIISHRGEHDNRSVFENTLPAFEIARDNGVWGIECDIRWTADLVPVVSHDACGARLFGNSARIASLPFAQLRREIPAIPSLQELVTEFGGNTHLMLEIKDEPLAQPDEQKAILQSQLSGLGAGIDYHFLALQPELFERVDFVSMDCCFPVSELNTARLSRAALAMGCGGLNGHFFLITDAVKRRHEAAGQRIGTGFIASRNCLFRELNRGVEWIFSNDAVKVQQIREHYLALARSA